jgi:hypothetical protein
MDVDPSRLRRGEIIVGAASVVLLASMFVLEWYGLTAQLRPTAASLGSSTSVNGWDALTNVRWLMLLTIACGLALVYVQAARRAPAIPVTLSVLVTVLGLITVLVLIYRVLINEPGNDAVVEQEAGAFVGLASAIAIVIGGYLSMRDEGIADKDAPADIETVSMGPAGGSSRP